MATPGVNAPTGDAGNGTSLSRRKKQIFLNAFDMSTVGHLSPGQWKVSDFYHTNGLTEGRSIKADRIIKLRTQQTNLQRSESFNTG